MNTIQSSDSCVALLVVVSVMACDRMQGETYADYLARLNDTARRYVRAALTSDNRLGVIAVDDAWRAR